MEAIQVYQAGIKALSGEQHNSARNTLQEKYKEAKKKLNVRVDFVTKLPYEVLHQILNYIEMKEIIQLVDISKGWRSRLSGSSKPWTEICLSSQENEEGSPPKLILSKLHHVSQHVEEVVLYSSKKYESEMLLTVIMSSSFKNIKILEIHGYQMNQHYQLLGAISRIKDTLRHLLIEVDSKCPSLPTGVILSMCPDLETLHCVQNKATLDIHGLIPHSSGAFDSLTDLELRFSDIELSKLESLLSCCPKLRKLVVGSCPYSFAPIVCKICPRLRALIVNYDGIMPPEGDAIFSIENPNEPAGLRYLCMFPHHSDDNLDPIIDVLHNCAPVLETWNLAVFEDDIMTSNWNDISSITFPKLQYINVHTTQNFNSILAIILSGCPSLQDLLLSGSGFDHDIFHAMAELPSLQRLELSYAKGVNLEAITFMFRALEERQHPLYSLELDNCSFTLTDATLQAIAGISSLRSFGLMNVSIKDQDTFNRFACKLLEKSNNTHMRVIILCNVDAVHDDSIQYLCGIPSLQAVNLYELSNVTSTGLDYIRTHKALTLYENPY
ncbi:hypothetical protein BDC45DRAFT_496175 [Circinella umbellata]|nr:hypothetical protein BDC45DRAFT_496175 [Circinella umbellata]